MPIERERTDEKTLLRENVSGGLGSDESEPKVPSNIYLLNVAFYSFAIFALGQIFVAIFLAKSAAMVADSSAMVIDSLTYLFNSYAERIKNMSLSESDDETLTEAVREMRKLRRTRQRLWLEILPPLCSVLTLIVLTICIILDATNTLLEPTDDVFLDDGSISTVNDPNIGTMFLFSALNLGLDILNVSCFARAKHAFGFAVIDKDRHRYMLAYNGSLHNEFADNIKGVRSEVDLHGLDNEEESFMANYRSVAEETFNPFYPEISKKIELTNEVNLNMCSAYTHVFADTLRSIAVLLAAGLSYTFKVGEPKFVDAVASLAVSFIILCSLGPLLRGIFHASEQLRRLSNFATRLSEKRPMLLKL